MTQLQAPRPRAEQPRVSACSQCESASMVSASGGNVSSIAPKIATAVRGTPPIITRGRTAPGVPDHRPTDWAHGPCGLGKSTGAHARPVSRQATPRALAGTAWRLGHSRSGLQLRPQQARPTANRSHAQLCCRSNAAIDVRDVNTEASPKGVHARITSFPPTQWCADASRHV